MTATTSVPLPIWHVTTDEVVDMQPVNDTYVWAWDDMLAVTFDRPIDDTEKDQAVAAIGYAWQQHGGQRDHHLDQSLIMWILDRTVVVHAPLASRPTKTRTPAVAAQDLLRDIDLYVRQGSPERKRLPGRLVQPLDPPACVVGFHCY